MEDFAFGQLSLEDTVEYYQLECANFEVVDDWYASRSFGSHLGAYIVASLQQMISADPIDAGLQHNENVRLAYFAGHDVNQVFLRSLLRVEWFADGWRQNNPPPGGMIIFELHDIDGVYNIRSFFEVPTPIQIRNLQEFSESKQPSRVPIAIPGCSDGPDLDCPLDQFSKYLTEALLLDCIHNDALKQYSINILDEDTDSTDDIDTDPTDSDDDDDDDDNNNNADDDDDSVAGWAWMLGGIGIGCLVAFVVVFVWKRYRNRRDGHRQPLLNASILQST
jgi:hypothetical protein